MSPLSTTIKSGWITDLVLPGPTGIQTPTTVLEAGAEIAIAMASDPIFMARLNPLVQKVEEIPSSHEKAVDYLHMGRSFGVVDVDGLSPGTRDDLVSGREGEWKHYAITDKLTPLPGYTTELIYYSAIRRTKTGMECLTNPGSGVSIYGKFSIKVAAPSDVKALDASDGKGWVVNFLETNETRCNVLLGYYIKATTDKSHRSAHKRFKEVWRQRMKERGFDCAG